MKDLLKFLTCGSVDDGKSTLLGKMLYDGRMIPQDVAKKLQSDSQSTEDMDYALLLDGLQAEREQGITIDVAYRYFQSEHRSFIVADTPGHWEYTPNMAVGASFAELAVILVDSTSGILPQTKRHLEICSFMGIRHFVFAVNKMDLVDYEEAVFADISQELALLQENIPCDSWEVLAVSAKQGDNIYHSSKNMPWYKGAPLISYLESVEVQRHSDEDFFVFPVQRVCRGENFRGLQGEVAQGQVKVGEKLHIYPSGEEVFLKNILEYDKALEETSVGMAVTLQVDREVDCSRGSVLSTRTDLSTEEHFSCKLLWLSEENLQIGQSYLLKLGTKTVPVVISKVDGDTVGKNCFCHCDITLGGTLCYGTHELCPSLGRFVLIHRVSKNTCGCGVITGVSGEDAMEITREIRSKQKKQQPRTLWFTGLSGAGKSTLTTALEQGLLARGKHSMLLDGDNVRQGLCADLGFSPEDRRENIRRIAECCKLLNDAGLVVLVAVISPYSADRAMAKSILGESFVEIYVNTPLTVCEQRDPKGLYQKARTGEIPEFTGVSSPYEAPKSPDFVVDTEGKSPKDSVEEILSWLSEE